MKDTTRAMAAMKEAIRLMSLARMVTVCSCKALSRGRRNDVGPARGGWHGLVPALMSG